MDTSEPQNTAKAALIVFQEIRPQLLQYSSNPAKLRGIIEPIFGFECNRRTIGALGAGPIIDLVKIAKGPKESPSGTHWPPYTNLSDVLLRRIPNSRPRWEIWRGFITRFHLWGIIPFTARTKIVTALSTRRINPPIELTSPTFTETSALYQDCAWGGNLILLWQSAICVSVTKATSRRAPHPPGGELRINELVCNLG